MPTIEVERILPNAVWYRLRWPDGHSSYMRHPYGPGTLWTSDSAKRMTIRPSFLCRHGPALVHLLLTKGEIKLVADSTVRLAPGATSW